MVIKYGSAPKRFQSTWDTTQAGSANDTVVLPLQSAGSYDFYIDWGDGKENRDNITVYNQAEVTHQYDTTGIYTIKVVGGITGWQFNNGGDDDKITEISKWGPLRFVSNDTNLFYGCSNLDVVATDSLTLGGAFNGQSMFNSCLNLGSEGNMSSWDTSSVTNMANMFYNCTSFNQDVGNWDVSNVIDMNHMFRNCIYFNQDLSNWNVSNLQNARSLFARCPSFNNGGSPDISGWNMGNVTDMRYVFFNAADFNQPIGTWDTSQVNTMQYMFHLFGDVGKDGSFNQDIGNWNVAKVTDMSYMFSTANVNNAHVFNNGGSPSISGWNTSLVKNMYQMFYNNTYFNQPIGAWNTSSLTNIQQMLSNADAFDQDLSNWVVTGVNNATNFMANASGLSTTNYDSTLSGWSSQAVQNGVNIHFGNSQYSTATGLAYRNALVASGWTITDGGAV